MSEIRPGRFERVLVLAPHTDDELGCAGTMARLRREGAELRYLAFSACEESVPVGLRPDVLRDECVSCMLSLGLRRVDILRYKVRRFPACRQEILERLVQLRKWPDLVLLPCSDDVHQDHHVIHEEGVRAFKHTTLLGYELPQNLRTFHNAAWVRLLPEDLDAKVCALRCYESQSHRPYTSAEYLRALASVRGLQAGVRYAEAYEVIRWLV